MSALKEQGIRLPQWSLEAAHEVAKTLRAEGYQCQLVDGPKTKQGESWVVVVLGYTPPETDA